MSSDAGKIGGRMTDTHQGQQPWLALVFAGLGRMGRDPVLSFQTGVSV